MWMILRFSLGDFPVDIYLFKVNNGNTRTNTRSTSITRSLKFKDADWFRDKLNFPMNYCHQLLWTCSMIIFSVKNALKSGLPPSKKIDFICFNETLKKWWKMLFIHLEMFIGPLSRLRQFLKIETRLKMMNNPFHVRNPFSRYLKIFALTFSVM